MSEMIERLKFEATHFKGIDGHREKDALLLEAAGEIERLLRIEEAARLLMLDVHRRYPGEGLRCQFMRALDAALSPSSVSDEQGVCNE